MKMKRVLLSVSDKTGIVELGRALSLAGAELVATGKTQKILEEAGLKTTPIESVTGNPEAFGGRMKTISFQIFSGILFRRGNDQDLQDVQKLGVKPIDAVVVNFYPFEKDPTIEQIDIGGPSLVRAAAKNAPDVLVLTDPSQYSEVISSLQKSGEVGESIVRRCASDAWARVLEYDRAIAWEYRTTRLRYGENPHQKGMLLVDRDSPVVWDEPLTGQEISYNNVLDVSGAFLLASDLKRRFPDRTSVVIVKHNNPCGVASVPGMNQRKALELAWAGDPVSAFGGVVVFTDPISNDCSEWLSERFVECVAAPELKGSSALEILVKRRKNLKALQIRSFELESGQTGKSVPWVETAVPGARLIQEADCLSQPEELKSVTEKKFPDDKKALGQFGIAVCRSLKSNAIAIVIDTQGSFQLIGAGQGQPNRIDAISVLAVPRAKAVCQAQGLSAAALLDAIVVSDAFFPFRDAVDEFSRHGLETVIQPGGSIRDPEVIGAANELGICMAFTGVRHFRH